MPHGARRTTFRARGALGLLLLSAGLAAQGQAPTTTFRTEANYVRVDVYPTRDGAPVTDLTQQDFDVIENGSPQKIEQFEHVTIRTVGVQDARRDPATVEESRQAVAEPRARVFVLFLDVNHVEGSASRQIQQPLINGLNRLIAPDDLIAVMTPDMSARDLIFARRTDTLARLLAKWWGQRDQLNPKDKAEEQYAACYPGLTSDQGIAQEMILRRREKASLDALTDLVRVLRGLREERKAIITISDGWRLFKPNDALTRPIDNPPPSVPRIGIDPRSGKLSTAETQNPNDISRLTCERDRIALAALDDEQGFREVQDEANRANASFYPIDPRGLVVFDEDIVPAAGVGVGAANPTLSPRQDQARLATRHTSLRLLAEATDGLAILDTNNLAAGFRRIADDLSSYYLLGYYSTGKLDGKFHSITVKVKRPGVQVRARRGYLAAVSAALTAVVAAAPAAAVSAEAQALQKALGSLDSFTREQPVRLHVAAGWTPDHAARVWAVAEAGRSAGGSDWTGGAQADALLIDATGATVASARMQVAPGAWSARLELTPSASLPAGDYQVTIRTKGVGAAAASTDSVKISIPESPSALGALFIRRGPTTGNKEVATADLRFRRTDRLRVEVPASSTEAVTARLLDRRGTALAIPVATAARDDPGGMRWQTAEVVLAPFAAGDYVIEMASGSVRTLVAFRVVP